MEQALRNIEGWIEAGSTRYVTITGVHGVMESVRDDDLRAIHNSAGMVTPDGMPLVWLGKLLGDAPVERVYGPDLMLRCCERSVSEGIRHFLYGGAEGVPEELSARLTERFPSLQIAGFYSPPFRQLTADEEEEVVKRINDSGADIVWVGLGTPKQELWMHRFRGRLRAAVLIGVGAAFDFHAGRKRQAPVWMQRTGLEWCFRLMTEPRRLWRRYLINNPAFVARVILQLSGLRKYPI